MWCVLATKVGREELIQQMCKRHLNKKIYSRCMFPLCEQREHYRGTWHTKLEKVFPGYLFFDTGDPDELSRQLRKEKIMAQNDKLFVLTPEDVQCLLFFGRTGVFPMSQGIIVNGRVIILSGPLEIIRDGEYFKFITPYDTEKMAGVIYELLKKPEERLRLSNNSRSNLESFSKETILSEWKELIEQFVNLSR